jgi:hypothetical protein
MSHPHIQRVSTALDAYAVKIHGRAEAKFEPQEQTITDLLADLMHFCRFNDLDFADLLRQGSAHYEAETIGYGGRDIDRGG